MRSRQFDMRPRAITTRLQEGAAAAARFYIDDAHCSAERGQAKTRREKKGTRQIGLSSINLTRGSDEI